MLDPYIFLGQPGGVRRAWAWSLSEVEVPVEGSKYARARFSYMPERSNGRERRMHVPTTQQQ